MGIAGVRSPDNVKFFHKKPLCVVYYDVGRGGREGGREGLKEKERVPHEQ